MTLTTTITTSVVNTAATIHTAGFTAPDTTPEAPPGTEKGTSLLISWAQWGSYIALAIGLIIFFARMISQRKHGEGAQMDGLAWILVGVIGVSAAIGIVTTLANANG